MTLKEILAEVEPILKSKWETRAGRSVPDAEGIILGKNSAVDIEGTVLYADMADSTGLVNGFRPWFAAGIYKSYLLGASRIIRENAGEITAFDGDRVMAVFTGGYKNTGAVKTALQISAFVLEFNAALKRIYPTTAFTLRQSVGIDTSALFVAKTGIRNANDLVWVGRAANYAAKLCTLGSASHPIYITDDVFTRLNEETKFAGSPKQLIWEKQIWNERGIVVHRSSWIWKF